MLFHPPPSFAKSFASADSIATYGIAGAAKSAAIIGLTVAAAETLKAQLRTQKDIFEQGGILQGPSHAAGGIQLYSRSGYHFGEAEGGEPILTAGVSRSPHLLAAASAINVAAGGRPLLPRPYMAVGGITSALVRESVNGRVGTPGALGTTVNVPPVDYERLAQATAKALRQSPPVTRVSDIKAGLNRDSYTSDLANF